MENKAILDGSVWSIEEGQVSFMINGQIYDLLNPELEYKRRYPVKVELNKEGNVSYVRQRMTGSTEEVRNILTGNTKLEYRKVMYKSIALNDGTTVAFSMKDKIPGENLIKQGVGVGYNFSEGMNPIDCGGISIYSLRTKPYSCEEMIRATDILAEFCREREDDLGNLRASDLEFVWNKLSQ